MPSKLLIYVLCIATLVAILSTRTHAAPLKTYDNLSEGYLANGMRYQVIRHPVPAQQIQLRLFVASGSLNEADDQRGLAHVIEHHAFRGRAEGLLKGLEAKAGVRFGAHSNASTGFGETIYFLTLTIDGSDTTSLTDALQWLRYVAYDLEFGDTEIDSERAVVLNELADRNGVGLKSSKAELAGLWPEARVNHRFPGGDPEIVAGAGRATLEDYYRTWYRPDRMTVMAVGDIPPNMEELLAEYLVRIPRPAPPGGWPKPELWGTKPRSERTFILFQHPDVPQAKIELIAVHPDLGRLNDTDTATLYFARAAARRILNNRLSELVRNGDPALYSTNFVGDVLGEVLVTYLISKVRGSWEDTLSALVREVARIHRHGVSEDEVAGALRAMDAQLVIDAAQQTAQSSESLTAQMVDAAADGIQLVSPDQALHAFRTAKVAIHADLVTETLKNLLPEHKLSVEVSTNSTSGIVVTSERVWDVFDAAVERGAEPRVAESLITSLGAVQRTRAEVGSATEGPMGVSHVTLNNGIVLHHRRTATKPGTATVQVSFAGGTVEEDTSNRGITLLGSSMFEDPRTPTLTSGQISTFFSDKTLNRSVYVDDAIVTEIMTGSKNDLDLGMQLVSLVLREGMVDPTALLRKAEFSIDQIRGHAMRIQNTAPYQTTLILAGHDPRFAYEDAEALRQLAASPDVVERWMRRIFEAAPLEISVVGDVSLDEARAMVARHFGSLPHRRDPRSFNYAKRLLPEFSGRQNVTIYQPQDVARAYLGIAWSVPAGFDENWDRLAEHRALQIAIRATESRVRDALRRDGGFVYTPYTGYTLRRDFPTLSRVSVEFSTAPHHVDEAVAVAMATMHLAKRDLTDKEVLTAMAQVVKESVETQSPQYWNGVLRGFYAVNCSDVLIGSRNDSNHPASIPSVTTQSARAALMKALQSDGGVLVVKVMPEPH